MTTDDLENALKAIAVKGWQVHQQPVLLSQLPKKLTEQLGGDYKQLLGNATLKRFIKDSAPIKGYRLVEHPNHRAKLGIVPSSVPFEFPIEENPSTTVTLSRQDIEGFARVLRSLTPDELRGVSLPANLVVRLLDAK